MLNYKAALAAFIVVAVVLQLLVNVPIVNGLCAEGGCTPACRYATKNENAVGRCDLNYLNPGFGNDASCVCGDSCLPRVFLATIMTPNTKVACVGAHHQKQCSACPASTPAQTLVAHICLASTSETSSAASQFCMCMCVGPELHPTQTNTVYGAGQQQPVAHQYPYPSYNYNQLSYYG